MKFKCPYCQEEIEITQRERAKSGFKKFDDHKAACFRKQNPDFGKIMDFAERMRKEVEILPEVPEKHDMNGIISYLHRAFGRIPTESECLRFHMLLQTTSSKQECWDFTKLLRSMSK